MSLWVSLPKPWQVATQLAWEAYCAGSLPIAAVITDQNGKLVATGRNRITEPPAPPQLGGHPLAHAEVNALVGFDYRRHDITTSTLYTTTEPCPMCLGAIRMANVPHAYYASRDPWAGCSAMTKQVPYVGRKGLRVMGPQQGVLEHALIALQTDMHLRRFAGFLETWRTVFPAAVAVGEHLFELGLLQTLTAQGTGVAEVLETLHDSLQRVTC